MENDSATACSFDMKDDESFVDLMELEYHNAVALTILPKYGTIGVDSEVSATHVCATMKARTLPEGARSPVDIVVALDTSGSMDGEKIQMCKKTLELLVRQLLPQDRFGLVSYSSEASIEIPLQPMTSENKNALLLKIKEMQAGGGTNMGDGISLAFQELRSVETPNKVRSVFFLTDGHANTGISDHEGLVRLTKNCCAGTKGTSEEHTEKKVPRNIFGPFFAKQEGKLENSGDGGIEQLATVSVFAFGYGADHNASLLRSLSEAGASGSYYYVENDSSVGSAFGDALGGLLSVVAQCATLTFQVPAEATGVKILNVYHEHAISRENGSYSVNVGDFYADESRDVLVEISLATNLKKSTEPIPHLMVKLDFTDTFHKQPITVGPVPCSLKRPSGTEVADGNSHVESQWIRVLSTHKMKAAEQHALRNDFARARECIATAKEIIDRASASARLDEMVVQLKEDLESASRGLVSREGYRGGGAHFLAFKSQAYTTQRCNESCSETKSAFRISQKKMMAQKMQAKDPPSKT